MTGSRCWSAETGSGRLGSDRWRPPWSYLLLEEREREVFQAVSVFPAGFTLEAAEFAGVGRA
jgi:hypothetical protein